jgi:hypothetical protein
MEEHDLRVLLNPSNGLFPPRLCFSYVRFLSVNLPQVSSGL